MRRTRAFTLAEVLIWISIICVLISLAAGIFVFSGDAARRGRKALADATALASVVEQLGRDARCATKRLDESGAVKAGPACLILSVPGEGTVIWRSAGGLVTREKISGDKSVSAPVGRVERLTFASAPAVGRWVDAVLVERRGEKRFRFYLMSEENL